MVIVGCKYSTSTVVKSTVLNGLAVPDNSERFLIVLKSIHFLFLPTVVAHPVAGSTLHKP